MNKHINNMEVTHYENSRNKQNFQDCFNFISSIYAGSQIPSHMRKKIMLNISILIYIFLIARFY